MWTLPKIFAFPGCCTAHVVSCLPTFRDMSVPFSRVQQSKTCKHLSVEIYLFLCPFIFRIINFFFSRISKPFEEFMDSKSTSEPLCSLKKIQYRFHFRSVENHTGIDLHDITNEVRWLILGAFAKFRKATISFVVSVCPSVRMEQTRLPLDGLLWNLIYEHFSKICRKNSIFFLFKIGQK